ncbi:MAG: tetratricopeptide repeat protein [Sphingobacteriales bacterium]|nr:MAG: tetratricopeptide repeat protein [Sphingobacteriales bacterium]
MNKSLIHIFDSSACLSRRQMKDYVSGVMTGEECHAAEVHLCSCLFCSDAVDGLYAQKEQGAVGAMAVLDNEFLQEKLSVSHPEIHLNSLAVPVQAAAHAAPKRRGRYRTRPLKHTSAIAAVLLVGFGLWWYIGRDRSYSAAIAEQQVAAATAERSKDVVYGGENILEKQDAPVLAMASEPVATNTNAKKEPVTSKAVQAAVVTTPVAEKKEIKTEEKKQAIVAAAKLDNGPVVRPEQSAAEVAVVHKPERTAKPVEERVEAKAETPAATSLEQGNNYYSQGKYSTALSAYRKEMANPDKKKRQEATVMAARCYLSMGNKTEAQKLLQQLTDEGGPQKRTAKRLLKEMSE